MKWLLLIVFTNGDNVTIKDYPSLLDCQLASVYLEEPVDTNLYPDSESVRQIGYDAYCLPSQ